MFTVAVVDAEGHLEEDLRGLADRILRALQGLPTPPPLGRHPLRAHQSQGLTTPGRRPSDPPRPVHLIRTLGRHHKGVISRRGADQIITQGLPTPPLLGRQPRDLLRPVHRSRTVEIYHKGVTSHRGAGNLLTRDREVLRLRGPSQDTHTG